MIKIINKLRSKLLKKLHINYTKGKFVIIPYSGGKDSHLATIKLIEKGYYPILLIISLGKKNRKIFNCPDLFYFIRGMIHPRISLIVIRDEKLFKQIKEVKRSVFTKIMLKIKQNVGNWKELNFYISDNEIIDKDIEKFEIMKTKLQKIGIKTITLSQLIKNPTIETILKEMKKYKMRAIIVSIDDKLPKNMMLKELTTNVLKNLKRKSKITTRIQTVVVDSPLTNSFQTIVVSTPLSKEFTLKKYKSMIYNINMKKRGNYVP